MLADIIRYVLDTTLNVEDYINGSVCQARASSVEECHIIVCGPTKAQEQFALALKSDLQVPVSTYERPSPLSFDRRSESLRTSRKQKLAIVGMAGRFPDAADHEKFWDLLEAGLDVHRKVC